MDVEMFGSRLGTKPKNFYHGTDEEAARQIQAQGFVVRPGPGGLLGRGVYCTSTLDKAMEYAKGPYGGIVLELLVDLGRCKELQPNDPMMTSWQSQYDSAWAPFSARDPRDTSKQENCVMDPKKIKVVRAIGRNMGLLHQGGYDIVDGKLIRKFDPQEARRKQEEAARQQIAAQAKAQAEAEAKRKQEEAARQKAAAQARAKDEADAQRQVGARQNAAAGGMAFPVFKSSGSMFSATAKYCRNCGLSP